MPSHAPSQPPVWLASTSPRRRELLAQLGIPCVVVGVDVDETPGRDEGAADLACRLAATKARAGRTKAPPGSIVVGADTVVALGTEIFGKPVDAADAQRILTRLAGRTHSVYSAVAVVDAERERVELSRSEVTFRSLEPGEIAAYWATGEPRDKAGAYGIQGLGAAFVTLLHGSYSGVMGLPLFETARLLAAAGYPMPGLVGSAP
jgi:septum formation protein